MTDLQTERLSASSRPLLARFYRAQGGHQRIQGEMQCWVARRQTIIAALCLTPMAGGHWLTGLLVAQAYRSQGVASRLVHQALQDTEGPVWLFCHPRLVPFYQRLEFEAATELPPPLASRLMRYTRNKSLIALRRKEPR